MGDQRCVSAALRARRIVSHDPCTGCCCDVHVLGQEDRVMYRPELRNRCSMHEHAYTDRLLQPVRGSVAGLRRSELKVSHLAAREFQQRPDVMIVRCA